MLKAFRKLWNDERGNVLIIGGAALPMLIGAAGLATDTIQWALWKRELQRAADSAAIAGVYDRVAKGDTDDTEDVVDHDLEVNHHTGIGLLAGFPEVTFPADDEDLELTHQVRVTLAVRKRLAFSSLFLTEAPQITASATAASTPGTDDYCVVSLENTTKTGISAGGSSEVIMDCGMITNSLSSNAAAAGGNSSVTATVIAAAGGIQQSNSWNVGKYDPYVPAEDDPYEDLEPSEEELDECSDNPQGALVAANNQPPIDGNDFPGNVVCFTSISVGSNRDLTLRNGVFLIDGGGLNVQGDLIVENATIVLTNDSDSETAPIGSFDMNAQATLNMTAPTEGKWAGMAIYQDRRAVDNSPTGQISSNSPNKINGGSAGNITGVLYFPKQQLTYNGGGTTVANCTQFVIKRIVFTGNNGTNITSNQEACGDDGYEPIVGGRKVRLVA
jgi:Flp pilus assembly protein TadG